MLASFRRWVAGASLLSAVGVGLPSACSVPDYDFVDPVDIGDSARTPCRRDAECADLPLTRICDTRAGFCVECLADLEPQSTQCGSGLYCNEDSRCVIGCNDDFDCNEGLTCDLETNLCVGCDGEGDCGAGTACEDSVCAPHCASEETCPSGFSCCSGLCANLLSDPLHCTECGVACSDDEQCINGECGSTGCPKGFADCDQNSRNGCEAKLASDRENCGACGNDCSPGFCSGGRCTSIDCADGRADCDGETENECEADLESTETCALCSQLCASINGAAACADESCTIVCDPGYRDCDGNSETGCETDVAADFQNCGGCGIECVNDNGTTRCSEGVCVPECATGSQDCDGDPRNGCETSIDGSLDDCGACGAACALENAAEVCDLGVCAIAGCEDGFADCDEDPENGCEADLSSPETCGGCDNRCNDNGGTASCSDGECGIECDANRQDCTGGLVDGCETNLLASVRHCGECGNSCEAPSGSTPSCDEGTCGVSNCDSPFADCLDETSEGDTTCETNTNNDAANCGGCGIECYYPNGIGRCATQACELQTCEPGFEHCDDDLVNGCETPLGRNSDCRACGDACVALHGTNTCTPNGCQPTCQLGWDDCDGNPNNGCETPLNTTTDCGACRRACTRAHATATCETGACEIDECDGAWGDCDPNPANGCETSLRTNTHCGLCDVPCSQPNAAASCATGTCTRGACNAGFADCSQAASAPGCETQLGTGQNCAGCGNACQTQNAHVTSNLCTGTTPNFDCVPSCSAGFRSCDNEPDNGCETDVTTPSNCGNCNVVCNLPNTNAHACVSGVCQVGTCDAGFDDCTTAAGCERPVSADVSNCGACGNVCSANNGTRGCTNGTCTIACNLGFGNCDGDVSDGCEHDVTDDPANCGACGAACGAATPFCVNRACQPRLNIVVQGSATGNVTTDGAHLRLMYDLVSPAGSYRAIFVGVAGRGNSPNARPRQVTFNGVPMALASEAPTGQVHAGIYYLTEDDLPNPGSYELVVEALTNQSTFGFIANLLELTGVERGTGAVDAGAFAQSESCTAVNTSVNVATLGAVPYGILAIDGSATPANLQASGQTPTMAQTTIEGSLGAAAGRLAPATRTGAFAFNWTQPSACNRWRHAVVAIRPAVTVAP